MVQDIDLHFKSIHFHALLEDVVIIENRQFCWVAPKFAALFGYEVTEMSGCRVEHVLHPDEVGWLFFHLAAEVEERRRVRLKGIHKNKQAMLISCEITAKQQGDNSFFYLSSFEQISEASGGAALLGRIEEQFRAAFNYAAVGMALASVNGTLFEINYAMCQILAISDTDADDINMNKLIDEEDLPHYLDGSTKLIIGETQCFERELRFLRGDKALWGLLNMTLVRDDQGRPLHFIVQLQDISEKKEAEELLHKSDKLFAVGQLAAGVAHEVRNPLTVLKGFAQMLQSTDTRNEQYYRLMLSEVDRIELIIGEFLMLAKPQEVKFKTIHFHELMVHVVQLMRTKAIMSNVSLTLKLESSRVQVDCDENQIKQVLINMIQNALDAMPKGGEIVLEVEDLNEKYMIVRITDQGCGIAEDRIGKLGEPFYSSKEKGTGLGLMITYQIIEKHSGTICVTSEVNVGTSFEIMLPYYQDNF